jgi:sugar-specific transcriptional regulator TrmB
MDILHLPDSVLNSQQTRVYTAALELGTDTVAHIAAKSGLPRSTTYLIIEELIKKGLLSTTKLNHKPLISAGSPTKLLELIKNNQAELTESFDNLNRILPALEAINNNRPDKPAVAFYSGFEGVKTILRKSLDTNEILVLCSGYVKPMDRQMVDYLERDYFPETDRMNIKTLEILGSAPDLNKYIDEYKSPLHQIKLLPGDAPLSHTDKLIFGETVAVVSYDTLNGTVITHQEIAGFERKLFYQLWSALK